ncbi:PAS domain-containing protein [Hymenobacter sp. YC55]|uniref:PAS domain-containing protein n=1 Tax=Hymenobacter sp. YC55 TaxID=3034019 RepID=UPI0023F6D5E2|nr:PAS domain-containing protein [Hymenobacter sp. YC55]MDF7815869.1 PAS domain-containing protein [Hymenobacter sp. YC55]
MPPPAGLPTDLSASHELLHALLAVSLTGIILFRPVYAAGEGSELVDLAYVQLSPAAQRMLGLPAYPSETFRTLYPNALSTGIFAFYRDTFLSGQPGQYEVNYSYDGLDNFFLLAAQRSGELLLVSFSDTAEQQSVAAVSLRHSQAREQAARAEAEAERQRLYQVLMRMPANIALLRGPDHVYDLVNPAYERLFPARIPLGRPLREVIPELEGQGFYELFDRVYETGEPFYEAETEAWADFAGTGELQCRYYHTSFEPIRNAQGEVTEVLNFAVDVTTQVEARRQVEQLHLVAQAARAEAEAQRSELQRVFAQAPIALARLRGPDFVVEFANTRMAQIWGRPLDQIVGRPHFEALPDLRGQGFEAVFAGVLQTGEPYYFRELLVTIAQAQQSYQGYFNITYQPAYDGEGHITGLIASAIEVSDQVRARQQVQELNEELAAINEELRASNEEYLATNAALGETQQQLQQLNQELEGRVAERTQAALALQADMLAAAQRQVAEREAFYEVFEQAPAPVALLRNPAHRFEYVNPAYQQLFAGRSLIGQAYGTALPEAATQGFVKLLDQVYQTGETFFGNELPFTPTPAVGQPPRTSYFNFTFQAYREAGQVAGISIFAFDATEQVLARQEREAQRVRLQALFEQAPVAIFVLHGPTYILDVVNPPMATILGRTPEELLGRPYFEAMPELATQGYAEFMDQVWHSRQSFTAREQPAKLRHHQADEIGYFTFVYQPLFDAQGQLTDIMCVAQEETEQVLARQQVQSLNEELAAINEELTATNEELNESNSQLLRTNVDLDTFVYTASHDLKAPITNIESIALALRDTLPAEVQQDELIAHLLGLFDTTVVRFRFTIGQLTDISRLQLAHIGPAEPVALAAVVEDVRLDLASLLTAAGTQLTVEVATDLLVSFSPANLRSVVYNLLSNAIKYRAVDRPSRVRVQAVATEAAVVLTVQDNGLGMSAVQQRQLFGLFQRLHTHVEGTGVGLYITKRLIENAGGTIAVESQPNVGTTFTVTFLL